MTMKWLRKKYTKSTLVPGRDRPAAEARPAYSYYASRAKPQGRSSEGRIALPIDENRTSLKNLKQHTILILCLAVGLVCTGKVLLLIPSSKVVVVDTSQTLQLPTEAYAAAANKYLRSSVLNGNKLTLNTNGIARDMKRQFPELESVVVAVPLVGNRPVVYVSPTHAAFVLEAPTGLYTIGDEGYVLAKLRAPLDTLVHLKESSNRIPLVGKRFFPGSTISFALTVQYQLQKAGYTVQYMELPGASPYELAVYLDGKSYRIRFNLQADALQQSGGAVATLRQLAQNQPNEYLDMRTLGRAYYR